uniref:Peptide ABC transporter substrate-binding protein n=2 Tax=Thermorudis TaxID=1649508 RepID=A0A831TE68_9BACT
MRKIDDVRRALHPVANHLIDEHLAGRLSRRELLRRLSVLGVSLPIIAAIASACRQGATETPAQSATPASGASPVTVASPTTGAAGTPAGGLPLLRAAILMPAGKIDPVTVADEGGLCVLGQTGEYLCWADRELNLRPQLAESWEPNEDASVWKFTVRQGVTFHDGQPLRVEDVVATFRRLADPDVGSNALSAFAGILTPDGVRAEGDRTVVFELERPFSNFPYLVSSDTYNTVIVPENFEGDYEASFVGTGPFRLKEYQPRVKASFVRNPEYWGQPAIPDEIELRFYEDESARILAFQGREVDVIARITPAGGQPLLTDPNVTVIEFSSATHLQVHMRTDMEPFTDRRVRQALALTLDRNAIVDGLLLGKADIGNDHPFAPVYPSADTTVPQRQRDLDLARRLMQEAGYPDGFPMKLVSWRGIEIPDLAAILQQSAQEIGIQMEVELTDPGTYYGKAVFGESPWLDSVLGITDYGHRGSPDTYLRAALRSDGVWNAAHFKNEDYDRLVDEYAAATDLQRQRQIARQIEELLLEETPLLITFFNRYLTTVRSGISGVEPTAIGHLRLDQARAG